MTLLKKKERDKFSRIDVEFAMVNEVSFIIGSILFIVGAPLQIPPNFPPQRTILLITGTVLFVFGSIFSILGAITTFRRHPNTLMLLCTFSVMAGVLILIGSILFLTGNSLSVTGIEDLKTAGNICWIVGGSFFVGGVSCHLFSDQLAIYRSSPEEDRKYKLVNALLMIGGDLYLIGVFSFIVGASVQLALPRGFTIMGQIMWLLGSVAFAFGASFKLAADILKFHTSNYAQTSSLYTANGENNN